MVLVGLGNRIRFTLSAQHFAEQEGRAFYYTWPTRGFGARFTDLWDYTAPQLAHSRADRVLGYDADLAELRHESVWWVKSNRVLRHPTCKGGEWEELFRRLTPAAGIRAAADHLLAELGPSFVGVQVRAGASTPKKTRAASPVSWFVKRMRAIQEADPGLAFFLSCDDEDAQREIMAAVPGVRAQSLAGGHNTAAALHKAVTDLYVLAASSHILGPYYSTFVYLACALSDNSQPFETSRGLRPPRGTADGGTIARHSSADLRSRSSDREKIQPVDCGRAR